MRQFSSKMFPDTVSWYARVESDSAMGGAKPTFPGPPVSFVCSCQPKTADRVEPGGVIYHETLYHVSFDGYDSRVSQIRSIKRDDVLDYGGLRLVVINPPYSRGGRGATYLCICKEMGT